MKSLLFILFFITLNVFSVGSQNMQAKYYQKIDFNGSVDELTGMLVFNSQEWNYVLSANGKEKPALNGKAMEVRVNSLFNFRTLEKGFYMDVEYLLSGKCIIKDKLQMPQWEILNDSTKKIGNYNCTMAKGHLCGRDFVVWFSPDIPVVCGPWKLWGLPGLIVDARSQDGVLEIQLLSLSSEHIDLVEPVVSKTVTLEECKVLLKKSMERTIRSMNSDFKSRELDFDATIDALMVDKSLLE